MCMLIRFAISGANSQLDACAMIQALESAKQKVSVGVDCDLDFFIGFGKSQNNCQKLQ